MEAVENMQGGLNGAMNSIAARAVAARKYAKMTQKQAEAASGVKQSDISKIERGDTERPAGLLALARAYHVDPNWLDTGDGIAPWDQGVLQPGELAIRFRGSPKNTEPGPDNRGNVPLISWVQAGTWNTAEDPFLPGEAERWVPCLASHSASSFALRVRGDSMTAPHGNMKTYPEGSIIFVDPERRSPANGERIIAKLEGTDEVTFKVFKEEDGRMWLAPLNPTHEPIRQPFHVLGTVIGKWEDD